MRKLGIIALSLMAFSAVSAAENGGAPVIVVFGDSLSSGYQLPPEDGFAPALAAELRAAGHAAEVVNAAIAGDTTADGLRRADWMLRRRSDLIIVEFGANDMLRGLPPALAYDNLAAILDKIERQGAKILLAGMLASPNMGEEYVAAFADVYRRLAAERDVAFYPFFLRDVATRPEMNLPDGMHPNAAGVRVIAANIAPLVAELLWE